MLSRFSRRWYTRSQLINCDVGDANEWLFDASSLTARLKKRCPGVFRVKVISQKIQLPTLDEREALGLRHGAAALIRLVHLYCGAHPVVFARTVIPVTTITGRQRAYANLGARPLGAMLFADKSMQRKNVEVSFLKPGDDLYIHTGLSKEKIWGRRSIFCVADKPLLVSEYFLPMLLGSDQ